LEGISGVGKDTVAEEVAAQLAIRGVRVQPVEEPSERYRQLRKEFDPHTVDFPPVRQTLLVADRAGLCVETIRPSLERGDTIISVRSYLSTAVYQTTDDADAYRCMLEHWWIRGSPNVRRAQASLTHRKRRTCRRRMTGRPKHGRSPRQRQ
jgi:thymidylate kinase